jgi:predicted SnoaL-like aldol condensation-catalyzing enzyme
MRMRLNSVFGYVYLALFLVAAAPAPGSEVGMTPGSYESITETNRRIVERFVEIFYGQKNVRLAFETYVGDNYIQHNPGIADGREAAIEKLEPMFSHPDFTVDVKRILVDGDMAVVHLHARKTPAERGGAVVDMFRLHDLKIVEHWDVLQAIPEQSANAHPMF